MHLVNLIPLLLSALAVIIGIVFHESAHTLAAYLLGDKTARSRGRLSLNPLAHIDPFGTVLLPLLMILAGGPVFAFAKPVPVYLGNLKHPKRDELLVSLAGPAANILLAGIAAALLRLASTSLGPSVLYSSDAAWLLTEFLATCISINLSLAFFNLLPLPPLDGSSILVLFLKGRALARYYELQRYALPILLIVLYLLPTVFGLDLIGLYFRYTVMPLYGDLLGFALPGVFG